MMNPDFVSVPHNATVEQAIELVRRSELPPGQITTVVVTDAEHQLAGTLPVVALLRAAGHEVVSALLDGSRPAVGAESDLPDIACVMSDFNLMSLPVLDEEGRPIGLLAVDDVLEHTMPTDWRRRYGLARE
jgi:Mg/Co/Ni transporter MgtE